MISSKNEYFFCMDTEKIKMVRDWYNSYLLEYLSEKKKAEPTDEIRGEIRQIEQAKWLINKSIKAVNYSYEISTIESSLKDGKLQFVAGADPLVAIPSSEMEKLAKMYEPETDSHMVTIYEKTMFYAWRVAEGYLTLHEAVVDSSKLGNYIDSPNGILELRKTGDLESGGFLDGIGNTYSVTKFADARYALESGSWGTRESAKGKVYPLLSVRWYCEPDGVRYFGNVAVAKNCKEIIF